MKIQDALKLSKQNAGAAGVTQWGKCVQCPGFNPQC